jgi:hypothetical protein
MIDETRIRKTVARVQTADLPPATAAADNMFLQSINGTICSGCAEPIERLQTFYSVRIRSGSLGPLRLHPVCYDAWARFEAASP